MTDKPQRQSDGYRSEHCARCGKPIGYGYFDARQYVGVEGWVLYHGEPAAVWQRPSWCEREVVQ